MAHHAVKEKLATVGITIFPKRVDDPLWDEIRQSVTPSLTLQEMIALKNESAPGNYFLSRVFHRVIAIACIRISVFYLLLIISFDELILFIPFY